MLIQVLRHHVASPVNHTPLMFDIERKHCMRVIRLERQRSICNILAACVLVWFSKWNSVKKNRSPYIDYTLSLYATLRNILGYIMGISIHIRNVGHGKGKILEKTVKKHCWNAAYSLWHFPNIFNDVLEVMSFIQNGGITPTFMMFSVCTFKTLFNDT